ncbi:MAG TPA: ABC transporter ATP-binding protein [Ktedonobacterales bacterium]|nr:ABC transporter ATP-binding protein [Ktedonobacterales bacterium]
MTESSTRSFPNYGSDGVRIDDASEVTTTVVPEAQGAATENGDIPGTRGAPRYPLVAVRDLTKTYTLGQTKVRALRGVSLDVRPGELVAVMGPSGSGKSTFMNLLGCLDRPSSGRYLLMGRPVSSMSPDQLAGIRNQRIGFIFQGFNLLARSTALGNVELPMVYAGLPKEVQERRARRALDMVGLGARLHHKPAQLSGGQQQRVAIARALVNGPALLLADEPTGNLDTRTSIEILALLQALNERGLTIVLVTHEQDIAQFASRRIMFRDGRIVGDEPVRERRFAREEWTRLHAATTAQPRVEIREELS